jgi:formylglycine-generating enzyme
LECNIATQQFVREKTMSEALRVVPDISQPDHVEDGMVRVAGGRYTMGSNNHYPEEAPAHQVTVAGFWIDRDPVTNANFATFVKETGYLTLAERVPDPADYPGAKPELLVAGSVVFVPPTHRVNLANHYNWWNWVPGASWLHPEGPGSSIKDKENHPVVHVAFEDVKAYAAWIGKEIPTEAEWEFAARGGLENAAYSWGEEFEPGGKIMANIWQGEFPIHNDCTDGYSRTSPVGAFPSNGYGLNDMIGNVWEWTSVFYIEHSKIRMSCCGAINPAGINAEQSYDPAMPNIKIPRKVLKGGSFLCALNYCRRYRPAARIPHAIDTGTCHIGFRLVRRTN